MQEVWSCMLYCNLCIVSDCDALPLSPPPPSCSFSFFLLFLGDTRSCEKLWEVVRSCEELWGVVRRSWESWNVVGTYPARPQRILLVLDPYRITSFQWCHKWWWCWYLWWWWWWWHLTSSHTLGGRAGRRALFSSSHLLRRRFEPLRVMYATSPLTSPHLSLVLTTPSLFSLYFTYSTLSTP